jgi:hypothetical protein
MWQNEMHFDVAIIGGRLFGHDGGGASIYGWV